MSLGGIFTRLGASGGGLHYDLLRARESGNEALERLSTGKRINRAEDDPSGLIAAENLREQVTILKAGIKADRRELQRLGAADGALGVINDLLNELGGVVVSAANTGGLSEGETKSLQLEIDSILNGIDQVNRTARFAGVDLLGSFGTFQLGSTFVSSAPSRNDDAGPVDEDMPSVPDGVATDRFYRLSDLRSGGALSIEKGGLGLAQDIVDSARETVTKSRGAYGARAKSVESELDAKLKSLEEQTGALGSIEDADIAEEAAKLVRSQLLEQASLSAILIGRQSAEVVLDLLEPAVQASGRGPRPTQPAGALAG